MNTDIRVDVTFRGHRKRRRLARSLGLGQGPADLLLDLWIEVAACRPSGVLEGWDAVDVAAAAGWDGDPAAFLAVLVECRLLEEVDGTLRIHEWGVHQPWVVGAPERREAQSRAGRASAAARKEKFGTSQPVRPNEPRTVPEQVFGVFDRTPAEHSRTPSPSPSPKIKPSSSPAATDPPGFAEFWSAYPRQVGKGAARKAWQRLKINGQLPLILKAVESQKTTEQWTREGGRFIPYPATWLNQGRWEDEAAESPAPFVDTRPRLN